MAFISMIYICAKNFNLFPFAGHLHFDHNPVQINRFTENSLKYRLVSNFKFSRLYIKFSTYIIFIWFWSMYVITKMPVSESDRQF